MDKQIQEIKASIYASFVMMTNSERKVLARDLRKILADLAALPSMDNPLAVARLARVRDDLEGLGMALNEVIDTMRAGGKGDE